MLLNLQPTKHPVALGLGGGHYVPRMSDAALGYRISFGHMIPSYALNGLDEATVGQAIQRSPGASLAYLHRNAIDAPLRRGVETLVEDAGLRIVRRRELGPL